MEVEVVVKLWTDSVYSNVDHQHRTSCEVFTTEAKLLLEAELLQEFLLQ